MLTESSTYKCHLFRVCVIEKTFWNRQFVAILMGLLVQLAFVFLNRYHKSLDNQRCKILKAE
jgi:hypothetical protein